MIFIAGRAFEYSEIITSCVHSLIQRKDGIHFWTNFQKHSEKEPLRKVDFGKDADVRVLVGTSQDVVIFLRSHVKDSVDCIVEIEEALCYAVHCNEFLGKFDSCCRSSSPLASS